MKKLLKRIARKIFLGTNSVPEYINYGVLTENAWAPMFKNTDLVCVDVGGANGLQPHWQKISNLGTFVVYEPDKRSYEVLNNRKNSTSSKWNNYTYINSALSRTGGERKFNLYNAPTGSTFYEFKKNREVDEVSSLGNEYVHPIQRIILDTVSLKASLDGNKVGRIDLIKLDVQGAELEILEGLDDERWSSLLCCEAEVNFQDFYIGASTYESVKKELTDRGFVLFDLRISKYYSTRADVTQHKLAEHFGVEHAIPSLAGKIWEADHIYFRSNAWALENLKSFQELKRLIMAYCIYNYYFDAILLCEKWVEKHPSSKAEIEQTIVHIKNIHAVERLQLKPVEDYLKLTKGQNWGQYMWVPYPSV
jgi:FkbM family methyltransferase